MHFRILAAAIFLAASCGIATAASTDVVFQGGGTITSTTGCNGWDPAKQFFHGTYWAPVAGSTNGPDTVVTFHFGNGTAEGFQRDKGTALGSKFVAVWAVHAYTRIGTYDAQMRITSRSPATLATNTQSVALNGAIKGWDRDPDCIANFTMRLVRDLQP